MIRPEDLLILAYVVLLVTVGVGIPSFTVWAIIRYLARRRQREAPTLSKQELEAVVEEAVRRAVAPLEIRLDRLERRLLPPSTPQPSRWEAEQPGAAPQNSDDFKQPC